MNKFCRNFLLKKKCKIHKCNFVHYFPKDVAHLRFKNQRVKRFDHVSEREVVQLLFSNTSQIEFYYDASKICWALFPNALQIHQKLHQLDFVFQGQTES